MDVEPNKTKLDIPQADDVNKIMQLPLRVVEGYNTSTKIQTVFGFVNRQSSYYRHAAELLGLVETNNDVYKLTEVGKNYIQLSADKKSNFICKLLLQFPIINEVFLEITSDKEQICKIIVIYRAVFSPQVCRFFFCSILALLVMHYPKHLRRIYFQMSLTLARVSLSFVILASISSSVSASPNHGYSTLSNLFAILLISLSRFNIL